RAQCLFDRLPHRSGLGDHGKVVVGIDEGLDPVTDDLVVVDEQDSYSIGCHAGLSSHRGPGPRTVGSPFAGGPNGPVRGYRERGSQAGAAAGLPWNARTS